MKLKPTYLVLAFVSFAVASCGPKEDDNSQNVVTGEKAAELRGKLHGPVSAGGGAPQAAPQGAGTE